MIYIGFLASHGGSNMQAIIDAIKAGELEAKPCAVISNNSGSMALQRAKKEDIPAFHVSEKSLGSADAVNDEIIRLFSEFGVDTIVLAGYMKMLSDKVLSRFNGRVLNIHPALLPKFGGKGMYGHFVHEAVIAAGETESGPTVHLVDNQYDRGRILAQKKVPVFPQDTPELLAERVLIQEHIIYPETLQKISKGEIKL